MVGLVAPPAPTAAPAAPPVVMDPRVAAERAFVGEETFASCKALSADFRFCAMTRFISAFGFTNPMYSAQT